MKYAKLLLLLVGVVFFSSCGTDKNVNRAKLVATKYWTDKAYPGKAFDVQVTEATKVDDGKYRVKALVDGQQRVGLFNPETENFDEGYYSLSYERGKKMAEMEEEIRYLKGRVEALDKENYQLKLRLKYTKAGKGDPSDETESKEEITKKLKKEKAIEEEVND